MQPALLCALLLVAGLAQAQIVGLAGRMGERALLMVDGSAPRTLAAGESYKGVKLLSLQADSVLVEVAGRQFSLRVGENPANVGRPPVAAGGRVVLTADGNGHFLTQGHVNGKSVAMVVDTGATAVSLSVDEARRIGLNYQSGEPVSMSTANGVVPAWRIKLASVRLGEVQVYDVDAVVSSGALPLVLLGNSFLAHFQMNRTNDQMVLEKRY